MFLLINMQLQEVNVFYKKSNLHPQSKILVQPFNWKGHKIIIVYSRITRHFMRLRGLRDFQYHFKDSFSSSKKLIRLEACPPNVLPTI